MDDDLTDNNAIFDNLRHVDNEGVGEYWSARDLQKALDYDKWENFEKVIARAKKSFNVSGLGANNNIKYHFLEVRKMVLTGSGAQRGVRDYRLSRYACYLIAQNADPAKEPVAIAQAYFNIQTFRQESIDALSDDERRLYIRKQVTTEDKRLFDSAKSSGVTKYGSFYDAGYLGLYGMRAKEISRIKNLGTDKILDRANATELAANLFRLTQTNDKLQGELSKGKVIGDSAARQTHFMIGGKVRQAIKDIGGVMPEDLPPASEHIKQVERRLESDNAKLLKEKKSSHNKDKQPKNK